MENKKKEFKVVNDEVKEVTLTDIKKELKEITEKGTELQKYIMSEKGKGESFALKRLRMEQVNAYCSIVECLNAQISILEDKERLYILHKRRER